MATDTANMAELIGPAGTVFAPDRPRALAAALDAVADPRTAASYTRRAAERSSQFTATAHAAACLEVYRRCTHARAVGA